MRGEEKEAPTDDKQSWLIGWLCIPYGVLICFLSLIPNPMSGRLAFIFCGGVVAGVGAMLVRTARKSKKERGDTVGISVLLIALTPQETADFLPEPLFSEMTALAERHLLIDTTRLSQTEFHARLAEINPDVLVASWRTPQLPDALPPRLRYVCYLAGSVKKLLTREHIERGLLVTNWGGSIARVVAECALMLIIASLRRAGYWIPAMHRNGAWKNGRVDTGSLFGRKVGIHGFGRVSRELAKLIEPFGVELGICAPEADPAAYSAHGAKRVDSLEELFSDYDVVVELAPLVPATTGIVSEALLRRMRPGGLFVNVGRGAVVDEEALLRVAREGKILVALDVYGNEPLPVDSGFRGLPNVILLPHLAGPTVDRQRDAGAFGLRNIRAFAENAPLEAVITTVVFDHSS